MLTKEIRRMTIIQALGALAVSVLGLILGPGYLWWVAIVASLLIYAMAWGPQTWAWLQVKAREAIAQARKPDTPQKPKEKAPTFGEGEAE